MAWIKRNLIFVIAIALGLALTGYCGYLLYTSLSSNADVKSSYDEAVSQLNSLKQASPYPSQENIDVAKADKERVREFLADFRKSFAAFPPPPVENQQGFQTYLEETLVRFRAGATNAGVELPPDYGFTFSGLRGKLQVPAANIQPWMQQLEEISTILDILYQAKINVLVGICRVPVAADDVGTGDCMLPTTPVTNVWGVVTPYKITFRGFSPEIAAVLAGFARASNCFIVKAIEVVADHSAVSAANSAAPPTTATAAPTMTYIRVPTYAAPSPSMRDRGMPGFQRQPPAVRYVAVPTAGGTAQAAPAGPETILSESPLVVTISVDAVKLKVSEH